MTDLTPEDLPGIGKGSGVEYSEPKLLKTKNLINNNCTEEKKNLMLWMMDLMRRLT